MDPNKKRDRITSLWELAEKIANELKSDPRIVAIWVFGSLVRGEADEFSDLDMAALVEEDKFQEFMMESREEKWKSKLEAHPNSADRWGDNIVTQDICISIDYLTLDRIFKCEWNELKNVDAILGGILSSRIMYDPKGILKGLKQELAVYPEQLRKRRILILDDGAATYAFLAEREIKRKDYVNAAYYLRIAIQQLTYLLFPLNSQYLVSKRNLLDRLRNLINVPKGFSELFQFVLYDLKPDETTMNSALKSILEMLEYLRKSYDLEKIQKEFPRWWLQYNQFLL